MIKWPCLSNAEKIASKEDGFQQNGYILTFVNILSVIFGVLSNSLVLYGTYRNKTLGKVSKGLSVLLAIEGLFSVVIIQPLFVAAKFLLLTNIYDPSYLKYCTLLSIAAYGARFIGGFSVVTVLAITANRYIAVIHPHQYKPQRRFFFKIFMCCQAILPIHFILSDIWIWYQNFSRILTALYTFTPYPFIVYAYGKIYFKLRDSNKVWARRAKNRAPLILERQKKLSVTSFLVVAIYLVFYLPLVLIRSLNLDEKYLVVQLYIRPWFNTLLFCSFSFNALFYGWRSASIRELIQRS